MILSPSPVQQFFDDDGNLLVGGKLFLYEAGTTTKQAAFTDSSGNTALPNPIILNDRGEVAPSAHGTSCGLWLDPTLAYKYVLAPATASDPPTSTIWTVDDVVSPQTAILAALAQYEATLGGVLIGSMTPYAGFDVPTGWLLCYGQAVSRTTYALLFATIGIAYGAGDSSTTFNLPDKRGRVSVGKDDMGGSPANRVTVAISGISGTTLGAAGGDEHAQADTLAAATTVNVANPAHSHQILLGADFGFGGYNTVIGDVGPNGGGSGVGNTESTTTAITATAVTTVTSNLTGNSQNMQPSEIDNWIIFTGVSS